MIKVRLFSDFYDSPTLMYHLKNQTPSLTGTTYKNIEFVCDDSYTHSASFNTPGTILKSPKENNIGFLMDVPGICSPNMNTLSQIGKYFCWYKDHKNSIHEIYRDVPLSYMFFHTPILSNNDFSMKTKRMSMVVSGKSYMDGHQKRLDIFNNLLKTDIEIDFFGRNLSPGSDKRIKGSIPFMEKHKALMDYKYSLSFENIVYDGWITEKFYDCIINNCVPITNSPTALREFNSLSYCFIDFNKSTSDIIDIIKDIYDNDNFDNRKETLLNTKQLITDGNLSLCEKIWYEFNN